MWNIRDVRSMRIYAATPDERMLTVACSWLAGHGGQHVRLSIQDVREITFRLIDACIEPSVQAIRTVNGGHGSVRVIHDGVDGFFQRMDYGRRWDRTSTQRNPLRFLRVVRTDP